VFRRSLLLPPALIAALALSAAPALAGEDPEPTPPPPPAPSAPSAPVPAAPTGTATLHVTHGCVTGGRVRANVTGAEIASVTYFVDGKRVARVTSPSSSGRFAFSMACSRLGFGAHRARAAVVFTAGTSPARMSRRFQITRKGQTSARFTG
jgi:hypothetical protein